MGNSKLIINNSILKQTPEALENDNLLLCWSCLRFHPGRLRYHRRIRHQLDLQGYLREPFPHRSGHRFPQVYVLQRAWHVDLHLPDVGLPAVAVHGLVPVGLRSQIPDLKL